MLAVSPSDIAAPLAPPRRRGRPPNLTRRHAIVRAALALFADRGFEGTSMKVLADACGMTEGRLYRYFARKNAVRDAVVDYAIARLDATSGALIGLADAATDLRAFAAATARTYVEHLSELGAWYIVWGSGTLDDAQRERANAAQARLIAALAEGLRARGFRRDSVISARIFLGALAMLVLGRERAGIGPDSAEFRAAFIAELIEAIATDD